MTNYQAHFISSSSRWEERIPFGLFFMILIYVAFSACMYTFVPTCIDQSKLGLRNREPEFDDDECYTGRIDDTTPAWTTGFFAATACCFMAIHSFCVLHSKTESQRHIRLSSIAASGWLGIALILQSSTRLWYGSSSTQKQGVGTQFYSMWPIGFICWMIASVMYRKFVETTFALALEQDRGGSIARTTPCIFCCIGSRCTMAVAEAALIVVTLMIVAASMTCSILDPVSKETVSDGDDDTLTETDFLDAEDWMAPETTCERIVFFGEFAWYAIQAWFWLSAVSLLKSAVQGKEHQLFPGYRLSYLGLRTSHAVILIPIVQISMVLYPVWLYIASLIFDKNYKHLTKVCFGSPIFHFGIMATVFLMYNISWALTTAENATSVTTDQRRLFKPKKEVSDDTSEEVDEIDDEMRKMRWARAFDDLTLGMSSAASSTQHQRLSSGSEPRENEFEDVEHHEILRISPAN